MIERDIVPLGDSALTIGFRSDMIGTLSDLIVTEASSIERSQIPGITDVVASYESITVHYDPLRIGYSDLKLRLGSRAATAESVIHTGNQKTHRIPVTYDGEDLDEVAKRTGLTIREVITIHSAQTYRVLVIGFVPGFAYLGQLDPRLVLPRRESPRKQVPAGSVAIAEAQTAVYPSATPGGWHLIGTSPAKLFDPDNERPARLSVGDQVEFIPK